MRLYFSSLCFRNPFLLCSPFTFLLFNFPKVPLLSFLLLCLSLFIFFLCFPFPPASIVSPSVCLSPLLSVLSSCVSFLLLSLSFKLSLPFQFQKSPLSSLQNPPLLCFFFRFPPFVLLCWVLFIKPSEWGFLPLRMGAGQAAAGRPLGATVEVRLQRHGASGWSVGSRRERPRQNLNKSSFFLLPRCMFGGRRKRNSISVSAPHSWPCVSLRSLVSDLCNLTLN